MTNAKAIETLRAMRTQAIAWEDFYSQLSKRVWKQEFKRAQQDRAALEHAITMLGMLELSGKPDYYDTAPGI